MGSETWRQEIRDLSDTELLDELQRPLRNWENDVMRETLYRLLKKSAKHKLKDGG